MPFLDENYLLPDPLAQTLYHEHAASCPVIDYHTHLDPRVFLRNEPFADITGLWITADPYKHRAMRLAGVPEELITGDAGNADLAERFAAWARTLPLLAGNPLYTWSHLELRRFFGIEKILEPGTAAEIRETCNARLTEPELHPRALLQRCRVETVVTSDTWLDDLTAHREVADQNIEPRLLPSLRADAVLAVDRPGFGDWLKDFASLCNREITNLPDLLEALNQRLDEFAEAGCRIADHGIDTLFYRDCTEGQSRQLFARAQAGSPLDPDEAAQWQTYLLRHLAGEYTRRGWTLLLHLGAMRQTSGRLAGLAGKTGGFAAIDSGLPMPTLGALLDDLEQRRALPRTLIFPLNPNDYPLVATLTGSFAEDGVPGKVQLGPAWWYNDHVPGMTHHLRTLANYSCLGTFAGMVTDSRSYLSGVRHELFRRVLCRELSRLTQTGELPDDAEHLAPLIRAVCHENAREMLHRHSGDDVSSSRS